ncbi:MAG: NAD(P)/FAD-dependent oxidoreductase [Phycisphaerae bacterium]|nr:NAD(P)/FAD-dependent oxidoreductase [Phycisphaerae bacterium]
MSPSATRSNPPRVVIIGGGFAGLYCARQLRGAPVQVTLIDRTNHHVFQPLLYQVATGGLSPANIAVPLRGVFRRQKNVTVLLGEVTDFSPAERLVRLADGGAVEYDYLVIAAGMQNFYFGRDEWAPHAPGLKTLDDATEMRRRILSAFEAAEREPIFAEQVKWLTFVVVGAGPTGLELAGTLAEIARDTLRHDFRRINTQKARILLLDGSDRVLPTYVPSLSASAKRQVEALGVEVRLGTMVTGVDPEGVRVRADGVEQLIPAKTVLWGAGVVASPLGRKLAAATGAEVDRAGRVFVGDDCSVAGHPNIFVLGDLAHQIWRADQLVPGVAPAAIQHGSYLARLIRRRIEGRPTPPFRYVDKGSLATIGRAAAVADIAGWRFSGYFAWLAWLLIHIFFLIHFQNRLLVMIQWAWNYFTFARSARLITGRSRDASSPP